jgi:hypothetical protein
MNRLTKTIWYDILLLPVMDDNQEENSHEFEEDPRKRKGRIAQRKAKYRGDKIMKYRFFSACLLTVIISLALAQVCYANKKILGRITFCSGHVEIKRAKQTDWRRAVRSLPVYFGDHIRTRKGQATIKYIDKSILKIRSNTHIALNTIISPVENRNSTLLFFGRIWNKVRKTVLKKRRYEVQTPTAVCGVRGTEFETASYEDGTMIVRVDTGEVEVNNEIDRSTLSSNQGTQVSFDTKKIKEEPDYVPEWQRKEKDARENLFADGKKYGGFIQSEIYKRRDHLRGLVDQVIKLKEEKERHLSRAKEAKECGDDLEYEAYMVKVKKINSELLDLNRKIAFYGRRLECQFGLFSHYGYLAKHPELSKRFRGKEFILKQLDNIEEIHAEFNEMIEEGMKMSMEDMEDLMDEMRDKMDEFRKIKSGGKDSFDELE